MTLLPHISDSMIVLLLTFIGGFVDAAGYLKLKGLFTSSITGNLVVIAASVSTSRGLFARSLVATMFTVGAFGLKCLMELLRIRYHLKQETFLFWGYCLQTCFILATTVLG